MLEVGGDGALGGPGAPLDDGGRGRMKTAWVGLTLALALVLQTTVVPGLAGAGVPVDLVLVVVEIIQI